MKGTITAVSSETLAPVSEKKRIAELDIVRGVALLGIIMANMPLFSYPADYVNWLTQRWWTGSLHNIVEQLLYILVEYKFISMFSLLFGIGFMIFVERADEKGRNGRILYARRILILLAIGAVHGYLLWFGDILSVYAVLGFFLLFFAKRKPKTLLTWSLSLLLIPATWIALHTIFPQIMPYGPPLGPTTETMTMLIQQSVDIYSGGTYFEIFEQRLIDISHLQAGSLTHAPLTMAMFLLGAYAWKKGWVRQSLARTTTTLFRKIWLASGFIGLVFLLVQWFMHERYDMAESGYNYAQFAGALISAPSLCIFYVLSILFWLRTKLGRKLLSPFRYTGQMALTNYLMQTVICTSVFYSYGLGLYGKVGPFYGLWLSIFIFALQTLCSKWWLNRYKYGPVEWLWRMLTYGSRHVIRLRS